MSVLDVLINRNSDVTHQLQKPFTDISLSMWFAASVKHYRQCIHFRNSKPEATKIICGNNHWLRRWNNPFTVQVFDSNKGRKALECQTEKSCNKKIILISINVTFYAWGARIGEKWTIIKSFLLERTCLDYFRYCNTCEGNCSIPNHSAVGPIGS